MPTSSADTPAISSAFRHAAAACPDMFSPSARTCLRLMPVREAIQSSLVSTHFSKSALLRTVLGADEPTPTSLQPVRVAAAAHCS
jgi:hypothetical protein